ncbi:MAG: helix-turn-helix domain-containing protein [Candidatus Bathyarchaeia archaeon]
MTSREELLDRIKEIERRLDKIERALRLGDYGLGDQRFQVDFGNVLELPDSLRRTFFALGGLGEATAEEVAERTGRTRSVETIYLNQLVRMGFLARERKGRKIYFKQVASLETR